MKPTKRNQRLFLVFIFALVMLTGTVFLLTALRQNTQFFYNPSEVIASDFTPRSKVFRIGGLVTPGTITKDDGLVTEFAVEDFVPDEMMGSEMNGEAGGAPVQIQVRYEGVLPDMFEEGTGVVVKGQMMGTGSFAADEVLAKHDENYQPVKSSK